MHKQQGEQPMAATTWPLLLLDQDHPSGSPPFLGESNYVLGRISVTPRTGWPQRSIHDRVAVQQFEVSAGPVDRIAFEEAKALDYRCDSTRRISWGLTFATFWVRLKILCTARLERPPGRPGLD